MEYWFLIKGEWPRSLYEAIPIIKQTDQEFFENLEKLYQPKFSSREKFEAMQKLYDLVVVYQG